MDAEKHERGTVEIDQAECKGGGLRVEACALHRLALGEGLNHFGYRTAEYVGEGCTACGLCAMSCPEPGAITVFRRVAQSRRQEAVCAGS